MGNKNYLGKLRRNNCKSAKSLVVALTFIFFILLLILPNVYAIGVTPGRTSIDFSPNMEKEVGFSIVNTEHKAMNAAFTVSGDLKEYITMDNAVSSFKSEVNSKEFKYTLKLPEKLTPGLHIGEIEAIELPEDINDVKLVVKATVSVVTQVYVYVPYPGKYVDVSLDIVPKGDSNKVNFYIPLVSRGEEKINSAKGTIDIYKNEVKIDTINTNEISIATTEKKELSAVWDAVNGGEYIAKVKVVYDGNVKEIEKRFSVGNESIGLLGVSTNNFKLGDVARIRILVQNKLSDDVKDASASLSVFNSDSEKITDLKSENYEIPALSNKEMIVYWDTEKLETGDYDSELGINYNKKFILKNLQIKVTENSMTFTGTGFAMAGESGQKLSINSIYYIVIGILVLVNGAWLVWWLRGKKKKGEIKNNQGYKKV